MELSASLYVPPALERPCALWVIPAHPTETVNSSTRFKFLLRGLPKDALVLWVHLYDEVRGNPETPVGKKYGTEGRQYDRERVIEHGDVFAAAVAMALKRFPVNSDRVYCWGVSSSGLACWWNAVCRPDLFAGICPCDTRPVQVIPWMRSLRTMRVGILHGEKDDRCPVELLRRVDKELLRLDVDRKFVEIEGAKHGVTWLRHGPALCAWIAEHARDSRPPKVAFYPDRVGDRCFWVEALELSIDAPGQRTSWGQPPAKVVAENHDDETIDITASGVKRLRVWVDKDATAIRVNQTEIKIQPTKRLREALVHVKIRRDPQLLWMWAADVDVESNASILDDPHQ